MHGEAVAKPQKMTDHHVPERPINDDPQVNNYDSSPIPARGKAWTSDGKKRNVKQKTTYRAKTQDVTKNKKNTVKILCMISIITVQTTNISHQSTRQHSDSIWT